ncbi:MAG: hypothetical protein JJU35_12155, partial [Balneolales bacterium]|nr:hypothetical protein [Balneolales bacterium]
FTLDLIAETHWDDDQKGDQQGTRANKLREYYNQIRDKTDTEKALYRLRLLGVVEDYTVDYRTQTLTIHCSKKEDSYYSARLRQYLSKFFSEERLDKEMLKASKGPGKELIQKYLNYLVDFGYEQIAKKRMRSISEMKEACLYGLEKPNDMAEYLNLYLNSKYAREIYEVDGKNESLPHNLDDGNNTDIKWVLYYIRLMEKDGDSELNNMKHLRGATMRLLNQKSSNLSNPVLLILKAYATFFLEYDNENLLSASEDDLSKAMSLLEEDQNQSEEELEEGFYEFVMILLEKRPQIQDYYTFEFENFRFRSLLKTLQNANHTLDLLDTKLN